MFNISDVVACLGGHDSAAAESHDEDYCKHITEKVVEILTDSDTEREYLEACVLHVLWTRCDRSHVSYDTYLKLASKSIINPQRYHSFIEYIARVGDDQDFDNVSMVTMMSSGNANVWLGFCQDRERLLIVKQHLNVEGPYILPSHAANEIDAHCLILKTCEDDGEYDGSIVKCLGIRLTANETCLFFEYIPMKLSTIFFDAPAPPAMIRSIVTSMVSIIARLHIAGIAHRDLKPENLAMRANGQLVLLDLDATIKRTHGHIKGTRPICTVTHRSPEAFDEDSKHNVDPFALDAWSVGVTVLELSSGKRAFTNQQFDNEPKMLLAALALAEEVADTEHISRRIKRSRARLGDMLFTNVIQKLLVADPTHRTSVVACYDVIGTAK
jgi:serine/threonine protein kinase